jgi:hypothetical protein
MNIEQIGLMLYKKGWVVRELVNNYALYKAKLSQTCLEVSARRGNFQISIIAGASGNHSEPKTPSKEYDEVEVMISKGKKDRCMNYVDEEDLIKIIKAPSKYV